MVFGLYCFKPKFNIVFSCALLLAWGNFFYLWPLFQLLWLGPVNAEKIWQIDAGYLFLHNVFVFIFIHHNHLHSARSTTFTSQFVLHLQLAAGLICWSYCHLGDVKSFGFNILLLLLFFFLLHHFVASFHKVLAVIAVGIRSVQLVMSCFLTFYLGKVIVWLWRFIFKNFRSLPMCSLLSTVYLPYLLAPK